MMFYFYIHCLVKYTLPSEFSYLQNFRADKYNLKDFTKMLFMQTASFLIIYTSSVYKPTYLNAYLSKDVHSKATFVYLFTYLFLKIVFIYEIKGSREKD